MMPERMSRDVMELLAKIGVEVRVQARVTEVRADGVQLADGGFIPSELVVWAAGVKAAAIPGGLDGLELSRGGQIVVTPTLQTAIDDRVFAMGDCASCVLPGRDRPVPPRAQAAHQMASAVFDNLNRMMADKPPRAFVYKDHGSLVSLSRFSTVGTLMGNLVGGKLAVEGRLARFVYLSLYRMHLVAIHGWLKGSALIVVGHVNKIVRPRLKLH